MKLLRLALLMGCLCGGVSWSGPALFCPVLPEGARIDGSLDDVAWQHASGCETLTNGKGEAVSDTRASFRVFLHGQRLFIGAELADGDMGRLETVPPKRDEIIWDHTLEIFLAGEGAGDYCHVAFTPGGGLYDSISFGLCTDYDYDIRHAVRRLSDRWIVEASLPLDQILGVKAVREGDSFRFNVGRFATSGFRDRVFAWSPTGSSFHNSNAFGRCHVGAEAAYRQRAVASLGKLKASLKALPVAPDKRETLQKDMLRLEKLSVREGSSATLELMKGVRALARGLKATQLPKDRLILAAENPWRLPSAAVVRPVEQELRWLSVPCLRNERRDLALSISNPTDHAVAFRVEPSHFRRWGAHPVRLDRTGAFLKVRLAQAVRIQGGTIQRDALVEIGLEHEVTVQPLSNAVIFLEIVGSELEPGEYNGAIAIKPLIQRPLECSVPMTIKVARTGLDLARTPYSCNWASYQAKACRDRKAAMRDQREHGTNVHIVKNEHTGIASAAFDGDGKLLKERLDFSMLDRYVEAFGGGRQLYVMHFNATLPHPALRNVANMKAYLNALMEHLQKLGLTRRNLAWYQVDEPDMERANRAIEFYRLLLEADPEQQVFCTAYSSTPVDVLEKLARYVSIWVINYNTRSSQIEAIRKASARPIRYFSYEVLGRGTDPLTYRRSGYMAMKLGYEGIGFWSYDDAGNGSDCSTWNDFERPDRSAYATVYEGTLKPQVSVRWQAWQQTIQDYACMKTIQALASSCETPDLKRRALSLVEEAVKTVIARREQADDYQARLRAMLMHLTGEGAEKSISQREGCVLVLTDNDPGFRAAETGGCYTYGKVPNSWQDRCGEADEPVFFRGDATKKTAAGMLTDGSVGYPGSWVKWSGDARDPKVITFDFKDNYEVLGLALSFDLFIESVDYEQLAVFGSQDGTSWHRLGVLGMTPIVSVPRELDEQVPVAVKPTVCRFVRLELKTREGQGKLGEVRIYGRRD